MHVGIAYLQWRGKRSRHSRRMRTRNFAYLARGQFMEIGTFTIPFRALLGLLPLSKTDGSLYVDCPCSIHRSAGEPFWLHQHGSLFALIDKKRNAWQQKCKVIHNFAQIDFPNSRGIIWYQITSFYEGKVINPVWKNNAIASTSYITSVCLYGSNCQ